jgi:plasmid rolling circle replication initiator protein Rep
MLTKLYHPQEKPPTLIELSPNDWRFRKWKRHAGKIADLYEENLYSNYADRMRDCATRLTFGSNTEGKLVLTNANFCRIRFCPICQWRRRLAVQARIYEALPKIFTEYPQEEYHWLFLTLALKNCHPLVLRREIYKMRDGWHKLIGQSGKKSSFAKMWPGLGAFRALEITRRMEADFTFSCHPHFHALVLVSRDYFDKDLDLYIKQQKKEDDDKPGWVELWQWALGVSYRPTAHIKSVSEFRLHHQISELSKYITKPYLQKGGTVADFGRPGAEAEYLQTLTNQCLNIRSFESYGVLKKFMKKTKDEDEDLIRIRGDKKEKLTDIKLSFDFDTKLKDYLLLNQ